MITKKLPPTESGFVNKHRTESIGLKIVILIELDEIKDFH